MEGINMKRYIVIALALMPVAGNFNAVDAAVMSGDPADVIQEQKKKKREQVQSRDVVKHFSAAMGVLLGMGAVFKAGEAITSDDDKSTGLLAAFCGALMTLPCITGHMKLFANLLDDDKANTCDTFIGGLLASMPLAFSSYLLSSLLDLKMQEQTRLLVKRCSE